MADSTARLSHGWQPDRIQEEAHRRDRWAVGRFGLSIILALAWVVFSIWLSLPWLSDLGGLTHPLAALFVLAFVAYVPGFMNAFLMASLVLRPHALRRTPEQWPALSILIAAYNEEALIGETLRSIAALDYPGALQIMVLDDGSTDGTAAAVRDAEALFAGSSGRDLLLVSEKQNRGKARVLNDGLALAAHDLVVTIDADTLLEKGCLVALVEHLHASSPETAAVAGAVLVGNQNDRSEEHTSELQSRLHLDHASAAVGLFPRHRGGKAHAGHV